jgi:hypothetical protein
MLLEWMVCCVRRFDEPEWQASVGETVPKVDEWLWGVVACNELETDFRARKMGY